MPPGTQEFQDPLPFLFNVQPGDFPGGPGAKAPCFQCRRSGFDPWSGNSIPHAAAKTWCSQINKLKLKKNCCLTNCAFGTYRTWALLRPVRSKVRGMLSCFWSLNNTSFTLISPNRKSTTLVLILSWKSGQLITRILVQLQRLYKTIRWGVLINNIH